MAAISEPFELPQEQVFGRSAADVSDDAAHRGSSSFVLETTKARLTPVPPLRRSAELSAYESSDASTESRRFGLVPSLGQDPHHRLRTGGSDENAATASQLGIVPLDRLGQFRREALAPDAHVLLHLRVAPHDRSGIGQRTALARLA